MIEWVVVMQIFFAGLCLGGVPYLSINGNWGWAAFLGVLGVLNGGFALIALGV